MLHEIDAVLRALLADALPEGVPINFATPDASWAAEVTVPTVNLFLCRVNENPQAREGNWTEQRDAHGRVVGRQPPPRQYRVSYLLTAWDSSAEAEHALLAAALEACACDVVPASLLAGSLGATGQPVTVDVGHPQLAGPGPEWDALDIRPRAFLDVVVTVVAVPAAVTDLTRPPDTVDLGIGAPTPPVSRPPAGAPPRKLVRERG